MDTFVRIYDFIERTFWFTLSRKLALRRLTTVKRDD